MNGLKIILILALLLGGAQCNAQADTDTQQVQKKLEILEKHLKDIEIDINKTRNNLSKEQKKLAETDESISKLTLALLNTQASIKEAQAEIENIKIKIVDLEQDKQHLLGRLEIYIKELSRQNKHHPIKVILSQNKLSDVQKLSVWYEYFAKAEASLLHDIKEKVAKSKAAEASLISQEQSLLQLKSTFQNQQSLLAEQRVQQLEAINQYAELISHNQKREKEIKGQHQVLTILLTKLKEAAKLEYVELASRFDSMAGRLPMPIHKQQIEQTILEQSYLIAKEGTQVHAIHPGRVVFSEWLRGLGLLIIIDHGQGYMSLYGNNQVLLKSTGEWVSQGEQISLVGKSGGQSKSGLYFEIRKEGKPLDTRKWVQNS